MLLPKQYAKNPVNKKSQSRNPKLFYTERPFVGCCIICWNQGKICQRNKIQKTKYVPHTVLLFAYHSGECSQRCLGQYFEVVATTRRLRRCPTRVFQLVHNQQADDHRAPHYLALLWRDPVSKF